MAVSTPTLGGNSMPIPDNYLEPWFLKGTTARMANGALSRDNVQSGIKKRFSLIYRMLTDSQLSALTTALNTVVDGSSQTFLSPTGTSYTVVLGENGLPEWEPVTLRGTEWRWNGTITLEEV